MSPRRSSLPVILAAASAVVIAGTPAVWVRAEPADRSIANRPSPPVSAEASRRPLDALCTAIGDAVAVGQAREARTRLEAAAAAVEARIADLELQTKKLAELTTQHDAALARAQDKIVEIFARMAPEPAAARLSVMQDDVAAAVLLKLDARQASALLADMDSVRAARIAGLIAELGGVTPRPIGLATTPRRP